MRLNQDRGAFAEEFERTLAQTDTSVRRLERLCGISRRTLENWLYGHSQRPRYVDPILKIAGALHLPAPDTDKLLLSAGYPPLAELMKKNGQVPEELLANWQLAPNQLLGQKNAALPTQDNLPAGVTPFLGRESASAELAGLVRRPDIRLITVTGLGGVGKTRLAVETARSLIDRFDHGVYFIPLDNINNGEGFWEGIIKGLHIPADGVTSRRLIVEDYLRNKQVLLLLDNFEHLMPIRCEIGQLLSHYPRLNLLVTSRQALDLRAEQLYPIGGLSTKEGQNSAAFQLYLATVRRSLPGYTPTDQEAEEILALCEAVDGLPLALELAATWCDIQSPGQILEHLHNNMQDVWHDAADRPERQKSLWELFDYSWRMLPEAEQEATLCLSVLRGSFTPEMAMAIAECRPGTLKRLVQTSVVRRTADSRLMIHPLIRQFLTQKAMLSGCDIEAFENRFIQFTLDWTSQQSRLLRETFKAVHFQNMHQEWQHIERAWWLAVDRQFYDLLESCWDILFYFEARGNWGEGDSFFKSTREKIGADQRRMQARLDEVEAIFATRFYEISRALKLARRSLITLDELGVDPTRDEAGTYARLVIAAADYQLKQATFTEQNKQELREKTGSYLKTFTEITIAMSDGVKCCMQKDFEGAATAFEGALAICGSDAYTVPNIRCFLAIALRGGGHTVSAREQFILAQENALEIDIIPALVTAAYELRLLEGDHVSTQDCRQALEDLALELGSRRTVGRVAIINAIQYLNLGMFNHAQQLTRIGLGLFWNEVTNAERRRILSTIAQAYIAFGLIKTAPQLLSLVMPELSE